MSDEALNERIAIKVMGLEWRECKPYYAPEGWYPKEYRKAAGVDGLSMPKGYEVHLPLYSWLIEDAWKVVERLIEQGHIIDIEYDKDYGLEKKQGWSVWVDGIIESQFEKTAPLAICLAALKVVEAKNLDES